MNVSANHPVASLFALWCITLLIFPSISLAFVGSPESGGGASDSSVGQSFGGSGGSSGISGGGPGYGSSGDYTSSGSSGGSSNSYSGGGPGYGSSGDYTSSSGSSNSSRNEPSFSTSESSNITGGGPGYGSSGDYTSSSGSGYSDNAFFAGGSSGGRYGGDSSGRTGFEGSPELSSNEENARSFNLTDNAFFADDNRGKLSVTTDPNKALRDVSEALSTIDEDTQALVDDVRSFLSENDDNSRRPSNPSELGGLNYDNSAPTFDGGGITPNSDGGSDDPQSGFSSLFDPNPTFTSSNQNQNDLPNIGTAPEPGPIDQFTGQSNPDNAPIELEDVINWNADVGSITTVEYNGQQAYVRGPTAADVIARGDYAERFTENDITVGGKLIAGEMPYDIVNKIARGEQLTPNEQAMVGLALASGMERFLADPRTQTIGGPYEVYSEVVLAGNNNANAGQYSAFNANSIRRTENNYSLNPAAFNEMFRDYIDGTTWNEYGAKITNPNLGASFYFNPQVSNPDWRNSLVGVREFGSRPHSHVSGRIPGEYTPAIGDEITQISLNSLRSTLSAEANQISGGTAGTDAGAFAVAFNSNGQLSAVTTPDGRTTSFPATRSDGTIPTPTSRPDYTSNDSGQTSNIPTPTPRPEYTGDTPSSEIPIPTPRPDQTVDVPIPTPRPNYDPLTGGITDDIPTPTPRPDQTVNTPAPTPRPYYDPDTGQIVTDVPTPTQRPADFNEDELVNRILGDNPLTEPGTLGGIPVGGNVTLPDTPDEPTVALTPTLRAAFAEAGISNPESVLAQVETSIEFPTVGSQENTGAQEVTTETVPVVITNARPKISQETGLPENVQIQQQVDIDHLSAEARTMLTEVAQKLDFPVVVTSGYRAPDYNDKVGGAKNSQHIHGNAIDIKTDHLSSAQRAALAEAIATTASVKGWGLYSSSIHIDARDGDTHAHWGPNYSHTSIETGYNHQPEMEPAHRAWTANRVTPTPPPNDVAVLNVSRQDLATLEAINTAYNEYRNQQVQVAENRPQSGGTGLVQRGGEIIRTSASTVTRSFGAVAGGVRDFVNGLLGNEDPAEGQNDQNNDSGSNFSDTENETDDPQATSSPVSLTSETQIAAVGANNSLFAKVGNFFRDLFTDENERIVYANLALAATHAASKPYIPVQVRIDESNGSVSFSRGKIQNTANLETEDMFGENGESTSDTSLLLDQQGNIIYSDGTYAPRYENGQPVDEEALFDYVYVIERYRDGTLISSETNEETLPGNLLTNVTNRVFGDDSPFVLSDVDTVTYEYIDPDTNTEDDEYYEYTITLNDGTERGVAIPVTTSLDFYVRQLERIGYYGDVVALTQLGEQTGEHISTNTPGLLERLGDAIRNTAQRMVGGIFNQDDDTYSDLEDAAAGQAFIPESVRTATVHLNVPVTCPEVGTVYGYIYEVTVDGRLADGTQASRSGGAAMCGAGGPRTYATAIAEHLETETDLTDVNVDDLLEILEFNYNTEEFISLEDFLASQGSAASDEIIPNTTNEIVFEAKVTSPSGTVVTDWTSSNVTVERGNDLHLRWDARSYRRCLPFIADNGEYSLSRSNLSMTTGNTESEEYDLYERTGTYRIECDGQSNGEDGVDERLINVTVQ